MGQSNSLKDKSSSLQGSFSVLTLNVWFSSQDMEKRHDAITEIAKESDADVICFQEVTHEFRTVISKDEEIANKYEISQTCGSTWYYCMTLVKKHLKVTFSAKDFKTSRMGRWLNLATVRVNGLKIKIGNVHLESLNNPEERRRQLQVSNEELKGADGALLCGDFNFGARWNFSDMVKWRSKFSKPTPADKEPYKSKNGEGCENNVLTEVMPDFIDVWDMIHPKDYGYTFDSEVNTCLRIYEQMRYDRVMCSKSPHLKPATIKIVANKSIEQPIKEKPKESEEKDTVEETKFDGDVSKLRLNVRLPQARTGPIFPSDHFGLLATFEIPLTERKEALNNEDDVLSL